MSTYGRNDRFMKEKRGNCWHVHDDRRIFDLSVGKYPNKEALVEPEKIFAGRINSGMSK